MRTYSYTISGTAANDATWVTVGDVEALPGYFEQVVRQAMQQTFQTLTQGNATYGKPGEGGCNGPYTVRRIVIEMKLPDDTEKHALGGAAAEKHAFRTISQQIIDAEESEDPLGEWHGRNE